MKQKTKIRAEIVADSLDTRGNRLTSFLITMPRIILSEINTHRMLSKNTSSSRAIPFKKMVESVQNDPFVPIAWQKHHSGMQGTEYFTSDVDIEACRKQWLDARDGAVLHSSFMYHDGTTKQLCNRLLEPFMWTTMLITGSKEGWDNFFELRCPSYEHPYKGKRFKSKKEFIEYDKWVLETTNDTNLGYNAETEDHWRIINKGQAEIHIMDLSEKIYDAMNASAPRKLEAGEWHIPFEDKMDFIKLGEASAGYQINGGKLLTPSTSAVAVSTAMAARTSYTLVGDEKEVDYEKMIKLHDRLLAQDPPHSSPMEHCCLVVTEEEYNNSFKGREKGWFRNYKGFKSYREIIESSK